MSRLTRLFLLLPLTLLLASSAVAPRPLPQPRERPAAPQVAPSFGLNTHLATRYPDPTSMQVPAAIVAQLGVQWVREDFHWHRVQPAPDVWDWRFTDAAMRALLRRDIEVLGVLGPSVGWATPEPNDPQHDVSYYAPDQAKFVTYARGVVRRYKQYIKHWEIWNEPDNPLFWQPTPDPQAYASLLIATSKAIKAEDPDAHILIGGFNPFDSAFSQGVVDAGAWEHFDILAIHPYVDPFTPEQGNLAAALDVTHLLNYLHGEKPIWVTEIGWASGPGDRDQRGLSDAEAQASYLVRSLLLLWEAGVERSFWYMLKDDAHNPYGLIAYGEGRTDMRSTLYKPAFYAMQTLNQQTRDTIFLERRDMFEQRVVEPFSSTSLASWVRPSQPNGTLALSDNGVASLAYNFSTRGNDYVAFEQRTPLALPGEPYAVGMWVYGDGTDHRLRVWLRDAEGEVLQYTLGIVGEPGWRFRFVPINRPVEAGNRVSGNGDGWLTYPATIQAVLIDDAADADQATGTVYLDNITAIYGHEIYNFRLQRDSAHLDIVWSPPRARVNLGTTAQYGVLIARNGGSRSLPAANGQFSLIAEPTPFYLWHKR